MRRAHDWRAARRCTGGYGRELTAAEKAKIDGALSVSVTRGLGIKKFANHGLIDLVDINAPF